jgi:addiction module HigA family antidote
MSNLENVTGHRPEVKTNSYVPDRLIVPGEIIEEYLAHAGFTQASLAERIEMPERTVNEIIRAKSAITAEIAIKLAWTLGRPAHFWSNLESQYQADKMRFEDKERLNWLVNFPVNDMAKLGWIEKHRDKAKQLDALLRFFAVASPVGNGLGQRIAGCFPKIGGFKRKKHRSYFRMAPAGRN